MARMVLTLIGKPDSAPLTAQLVERVRAALPDAQEPQWLAEDEACDLPLRGDQPASAIIAAARQALAGLAVDLACLPISGRRKTLLLSDMDSTVIDQECIDEIAALAGLGEQVSAITRQVIDGNVGFEDALRRRIAVLHGQRQALLEKVYQTRITLKPGARTVVQTMRANGAHCVLVSGGFTYFTERIAARLGFQENLGNELLFENGLLSGVREPILGRGAKRIALDRLCSEHHLDRGQVLAVGDGANDIEMIQASGLGVALHASATVKDAATACINHTDFTSLLFLQGYRKSEFVD